MKIEIDFDGITRSLRRALNRAAIATKAHAETRSPGQRRLALLLSGEQGQAMVELTLTLPAMLMVMTAIFTFGIAFNNQVTLNNAVGLGGQYLSSIRSTTSDPCADTLKAIEAAAPNLTAANITLTININGTPESGALAPARPRLCMRRRVTRDCKGHVSLRPFYHDSGLRAQVHKATAYL